MNVRAKNEILITSAISSTRKKANRNMISFHKHGHMSLNETVLEATNIELNMYASFQYVDLRHRHIVISFLKHEHKPKDYLTVWNNQINKNSHHACVQTHQLKAEFDIELLGAFNYSCLHMYDGSISLIINF